MDKRLWAAAAAAVGAGALYFYSHRSERERVTLERYTCSARGPGIPPSGLTILHLSDFHFRANDPVQEVRLARLMALLADEPFDVLAFTGDLIHDAPGLPRALAFLDGLRPTLAAYCVPGNRDYWQSGFKALLGAPDERAGLSPAARVRLIGAKLRGLLHSYAGNERTTLRIARNDVGAMLAALAERGIQPLMNRSTRLSAPNIDVWFAGIDDLTHGAPDVGAALGEVPATASLVLLAHNPDVWLDRRSRRATLILSGHTHGGQLRFPILGSWYRQGTHLSREKAAGWFEDGETRMYVTRGLGESFPFRFGAPPQAALIRLVRAESEDMA